MRAPLITLAPTYRITTYTTAPGRDPDGHIFRPSKSLRIDVMRNIWGRIDITVTNSANGLLQWEGTPDRWSEMRVCGFTKSQARAIVARALDALTDPTKIAA